MLNPSLLFSASPPTAPPAISACTGYAVTEFRMQQATPPCGAWQELENYCMPKTLAASHRLKREFQAIHMAEGEDPLVFLGRVDKAAHELAMLGCRKSVEEVSRHIVNNLFSLYTIQSKSILSHPSIPRVVLGQPPQLFFNEIAGFETSSRSYLLKYGASCHPDVIVR